MYYEFIKSGIKGQGSNIKASGCAVDRICIFVRLCVYLCSCVLRFRIYRRLGPGHVFGLNSIQVRSGRFGIVQYNTIQYSSIVYSSIQYDVIQYNMV